MALLALSILMAPPMAAAQTVSGLVGLQVEIDRGCTLVEAANQKAVEFGHIDFGRHARLDDAGTAQNTVPAGLRPSASRLECNPDTAFRFQVDDGLHGGSGGIRRLRLDGRDGAATIAYRLYTDAARRTPLMANVPVDGVTPSDGRAYLPLYAEIVRSADPPPVGRYRDTLHITLSW
ncbi:MAG: Csu type fimbrial protein [Lysobacter sp.]